MENTNITKKLDSVALDILYEQLLEITEEYTDIEEIIKRLVDFFRKWGMSNLADEIYRGYYALEDDYRTELYKLQNVEAALKSQFGADLQHRILDYKQNQ